MWFSSDWGATQKKLSHTQPLVAYSGCHFVFIGQSTSRIECGVSSHETVLACAEPECLPHSSETMERLYTEMTWELRSMWTAEIESVS